MIKAPSWLSPLCLVIVFFATLITEWTGYQAPAQLAIVMLAMFTLLEWKHLDLTAKVITMIAISLTLTLLSLSQISFYQLSMLCGSVAFFAFFLIALGLLKEAALSSRSVNLTGLALLQQQPVRRYALLTFASHLLGILMSLGALNLLGTMIQRSLYDNKDTVDVRVSSARQRVLQHTTLGANFSYDYAFSYHHSQPAVDRHHSLRPVHDPRYPFIWHLARSCPSAEISESFSTCYFK